MKDLIQEQNGGIINFVDVHFLEVQISHYRTQKIMKSEQDNRKKIKVLIDKGSNKSYIQLKLVKNVILNQASFYANSVEVKDISLTEIALTSSSSHYLL